MPSTFLDSKLPLVYLLPLFIFYYHLLLEFFKLLFIEVQLFHRASPVALVIKNPLDNVEDIRDVGLIPGLERSLEKGMATHSSILAWRIPWTKESGGLQSIGS